MRQHLLRVFVPLITIAVLLFSAGPLPLTLSASAQNVQEGGNSSNIRQDGDGDSGDATGGQSVGVTGGARTRIDATNSSTGVRARTGDADGENSSDSFTGQRNEAAGPDGANDQTGDNELDLSQSARASTGDAVGGQVIGVASNGDISITATNSSRDVDAVSGDADSDNDADIFVGLLGTTNIQEGDNTSDLSQRASSSSGDGVAGQVIGARALDGGSTDIVAVNESRNADARSGDDDESNSEETAVGQFSP